MEVGDIAGGSVAEDRSKWRKLELVPSCEGANGGLHWTEGGFVVFESHESAVDEVTCPALVKFETDSDICCRRRCRG